MVDINPMVAVLAQMMTNFRWCFLRWTQLHMATVCGWDPSTQSRLESGEIPLTQWHVTRMLEMEVLVEGSEWHLEFKRQLEFNSLARRTVSGLDAALIARLVVDERLKELGLIRPK